MFAGTSQRINMPEQTMTPLILHLRSVRFHKIFTRHKIFYHFFVTIQHILRFFNVNEHKITVFSLRERMDNDSLTSAFMRLRMRLTRIATGILGDSDAAEDALQDAFCRLWTHQTASRATERPKPSV